MPRSGCSRLQLSGTLSSPCAILLLSPPRALCVLLIIRVLGAVLLLCTTVMLAFRCVSQGLSSARHAVPCCATLTLLLVPVSVVCRPPRECGATRSDGGERSAGRRDERKEPSDRSRAEQQSRAQDSDAGGGWGGGGAEAHATSADKQAKRRDTHDKTRVISAEPDSHTLTLTLTRLDGRRSICARTASGRRGSQGSKAQSKAHHAA